MLAMEGSADEILRANTAFYQAFSNGDYDAMADLWAEEAPVTCLHPLSPLLAGRAPVLASWRQILRGPQGLVLRCGRARVHMVSSDVAIVTCYEGEGENPAHLAATNIFVRETGRWRMVHHQAGPLSTPIAFSGPAPASLN
jgi:ketosteroid isomerase-like protein